jgi:hypothetical protein
MRLTSSSHFIYRGILPELHVAVLCADASQRIYERDVGGFIVHDGVAPRFYASHERFASGLDRAIRGGSDPASVRLPEALELELTLDGWQSRSTLVEPGLIPVQLLPVGPELASDEQHRLQDRQYALFPIVDLSGSFFGYFFSHEDIANTVHHSPPKYVCSKDTSHSFSDDFGGQCPVVRCGGNLRAP